MKKELAILTTSLLLLAGCSSVPITGRQQLLLVSDSEVLSSSLTQYDSYIKSAAKSTSSSKTNMVRRVGRRIANATEQYLRENGLSREIANFKWEFNLVKDKQINAFCMPGGKIVVYEGLMNIVKSAVISVFSDYCTGSCQDKLPCISFICQRRRGMMDQRFHDVRRHCSAVHPAGYQALDLLGHDTIICRHFRHIFLRMLGAEGTVDDLPQAW